MRHVRTPQWPVVLSSLASLVASLPALAEDPPATTPQGEPVSIEDLLRRLQQLENKNKALEGEVTQLREADGQGWLSEQRAEEIREIVRDTLADADTRSSLQATGMTAGWDDGFFLSSPDGRFRLEVGGMIQFRWVYSQMRTINPATGTNAIQAYWSDAKTERYGFELPGSQIWLKGHLFGPGLTYKFMGQFANTNGVDLAINNVRPLETGSGELSLQDAWVRGELDSNWFVRGGQFKLPFSREELVDRQYQMAVEPSVISSSLGLGYSQGIEIEYVSDLFRGAFAVSDGGTDNVAGQLKVNGTLPQNKPFYNGQSEWSLTGRLEFKPYGEWNEFDAFTSPPGSDFGLMFGFATHWQSWRPDYGYMAQGFNNGDNQWLAFTVDASANFGGASLFGSFSWSYSDSEAAYYYAGQNNFNVPTFGDMGASNKWGMVLQGAFYIAPKWELFARYELGQFMVSNPDDIPMVGGTGSLYGFENHVNLITAGVNWYLDGQDIKFTTDIGYALDSFDPSWFSGTDGWRVNGSRDEFVFRTQMQLVF